MRPRLSTTIAGKAYIAELAEAHDLSIPLRHGTQNPKAWYAPDPEFQPFTFGDFTGSIKTGGSVNFFSAQIYPHGNGTHTESVGHIAPDQFSVTDAVDRLFFNARLCTIAPESFGEDQVITLEQLLDINLENIEAFIIRTLPNGGFKLTKNYSGKNPPYLSWQAAGYLREKGVRHLLLDLPSVDREEDGGELSAHKAFWNYPEQPRLNATISEMIYVPDYIHDGLYLLNIQIPPMILDAAPSRPFVIPLIEV